MASNYLKQSRHGSTFYFRRRVPDDLRPVVGRPYLVKTLRTGKRRDAIILARAFAARTDSLFHYIRTMSDRGDKIQVDLIFKLDFNDLGGLKSVHIEADTPEEQEQAKAMLDRTLEKLPANLQVPTSPKGNRKTITETWEAYKAEKIATQAWKDGEDTAKYDHWPHVRMFIEIIGDKPISDVSAEEVSNFLTHVLNDPKGGRPRNRDKRLTRTGAVFRWAKLKRIIADDFTDLFRYPGKIEENPYIAFDQNDLKALFESNEYRYGTFNSPSEYWLPLIALHTGVRLNEACQLTVGDIGEHEGVPTIAVLLDENEVKRLKTNASKRIIPIHSTLIECGFLDYVATITTGRIFPELPDDPARPGNYGAKATESFTAYRRSKGVGKATERSNKAFHSFRTTLISALRKAEVPGDRRRRLAGHEATDVHDRNYHGGDVLTMFNLDTLKVDIEKAQFDIAFTPYRFNS